MACSTLSTALNTAAAGRSPNWKQVAQTGYAAPTTLISTPLAVQPRVRGRSPRGQNGTLQTEQQSIEAMKSTCDQLGRSEATKDDAFVTELTLDAPEVTFPDAKRFEGLGHAICRDSPDGASVQQEVNVLDSASPQCGRRHRYPGRHRRAYRPAFQAEVQAWANSNSP